MNKLKCTAFVPYILEQSRTVCLDYRHEFVMPEHFLLAMISNDFTCKVLDRYTKIVPLAQGVKEYIKSLDRIPECDVWYPEYSAQFSEMVHEALKLAMQNGDDCVCLGHLVRAMLDLRDSWAAFLLKQNLFHQNDKQNLADALTKATEFDGKYGYEHEVSRDYASYYNDDDFNEEFYDGDGEDDDAEDVNVAGKDVNNRNETKSSTDIVGDFTNDVFYATPSGTQEWRNWVVCMNDRYGEYNPLVGRQRELQRTIQVLCRRDKNNPLHIGESGVGKTALVWGLARLINEGKVPQRLKGSRIYSLDVTTLMAGAQYRGDMENRIKTIVDGVIGESDNNIIYIDEIHMLVGAGNNGVGPGDASNVLKPYLDNGKIRFIGSTTYEEYNRYFANSKGFIRRFLQIDIAETSLEETKNILRQLKPRYESFHGVKYKDDALVFAVEAVAKHIHDRFLPDKAIDLIDEAGAAAEINGRRRNVTRKDVAAVLSKMCRAEAIAETSNDDVQNLASLRSRMLSQIFGQDEAVRSVVEAVQMSRAGLTDDNKPVASLLFVGPTGVGKTELARVLARELGLELVRFDMSEYSEKYNVAKLIGAPAGYIGYDDGGLLTDAIRRTPSCVLLMDEIEKAHQDIYDILLQVMDYACLTDNKGRRADFHNVILIMTSNAGARFAAQASVGFNSSVTRGDAMLKEIKKTFKPEFLNRLSGTVAFRDMDLKMATLILHKKLDDLSAKLKARNITMAVSPEAEEYLLHLGFTPEYGAREIERVVSRTLKPMLVHEILFGRLRNGGNVLIEIKDGRISIG